MALIQCSFLSESLMSQTTLSVIIPPVNNVWLSKGQKDQYEAGRKYPTLYLLHGGTGDYSDWTRLTGIERYAEEHKLAVVMASVGNSFYTDMVHGPKYWTFISEEVPKVARALFPLSEKREDNFVAGLSMGGYGALKLALRKPKCFAAAASLSGVLDIAGFVEGPVLTSANLGDVFGELDKVRGSDNDLFQLLTSLKESNAGIPRLYQACGTEDFLYEGNVRFREHTKQLDIDLMYKEGPGGHEWRFWDTYIQEVLQWLPLIERMEGSK
jgi:putative tributyrin esterase